MGEHLLMRSGSPISGLAGEVGVDVQLRRGPGLPGWRLEVDSPGDELVDGEAGLSLDGDPSGVDAASQSRRPSRWSRRAAAPEILVEAVVPRDR